MTSQSNKDRDIELLDVNSESQQMSLFEIIMPFGSRNELSNTIDIYDALPKYVIKQSREFDDLSKALVVRKCVIRGNSYTVKLKPAMIEKDGNTVLIFAGQREELVEDALRKLAISGRGHLIENKAGVLFTMYELREELAATGHSYSLDEIKESIMVCRGATLECYSDNGDSFISSSFFPMIGITTRQQYLENPGDAKCYVQFNPMVTDSILNLTYRQYNYQIGMQIKSALARYIYKRMSHYWTQASLDAPYTPSLVSFLSQSSRELSPNMSSNVRAMKNALTALINQNVVSHYEENVIKEGKKFIDVRYKIFPSESFVKQIKAANHQAKQTAIKGMQLKLKNNA